MARKKKQNTNEENSLDYNAYSVNTLNNNVSTLADETTTSKKKILHKRSNAFNTDGTPKLPTADQLEHGEIAINYANGGETIALKNSDDEIVAFISKKALIDAPVITLNDVTYYIGIKDNELVRIKVE